MAVVADALSRWQWFWGVEAGSLSEREALGTIRGVVVPASVGGGCSICSASVGTTSAGSRHDFQWPERSVEVKATSRRAEGAILHRIENLDQLADPERGSLFLFRPEGCKRSAR